MRYVVVLTFLISCSTPEKKLNIKYYSDCFNKMDSCYFMADQNCPKGYVVLDEWKNEGIIAPESEWVDHNPVYHFKNTINYMCEDKPNWAAEKDNWKKVIAKEPEEKKSIQDGDVEEYED